MAEATGALPAAHLRGGTPLILAMAPPTLQSTKSRKWLSQRFARTSSSDANADGEAKPPIAGFIKTAFKHFDINDDVRGEHWNSCIAITKLTFCLLSCPRCAQGSISRDEFLNALTRDTGSGSALTREQAEALFDDADADRSGEIDVDEFASQWADYDASYGLSRKFGLMPRLTKRVSSKATAVVVAAGSAVSSAVRPTRGKATASARVAAPKAAPKEKGRRV